MTQIPIYTHAIRFVVGQGHSGLQHTTLASNIDVTMCEVSEKHEKNIGC